MCQGSSAGYLPAGRQGALDSYPASAGQRFKFASCLIRCNLSKIEIMNYYVYILYSALIHKYYIGITSDLKRRLFEHNNGISRKAWTRRVNDWKIVYSEVCKSKSEALTREKKIKSYKGGNAFINLICQGSSDG